MMLNIRTYFITVTLCWLVGCSSAPQHTKPVRAVEPPPPVELWHDTLHFGPRPPMVSPASLFELTDGQKQEFLQFKQLPTNKSKNNNDVIANYLQNRLRNFNYYSDTLAASDALLKNEGNCLSLAILTRALAAQLDVDIQFQLVETPPVYQKEGDIILSSQHVRTRLLDPKPENKTTEILLFRGGVLIDYFPSAGTYFLRQVDEAEFIGMYYRNKAAEAYIHSDYRKGYWLAAQTLELNPKDPHAINMIALAYQKLGLTDQATELYHYGIRNNKDNLDLLYNYRQLLLELGQNEEAQVISEKLEQSENENPFRWIDLANQAYNERDFNLALAYYRRAQRLAPYLHQPYAGMARAQYQLGDIQAADKLMKKALETSHGGEIHDLYQSKLNLLNQLLESKR